jgi:hypothetical protein
MTKKRFLLLTVLIFTIGSSFLLSFCSASSEWSQTYGGNADDEANSVIQTSDQGYLLVGYTNSSGSHDAWLVKTDSSGIMQWNKTYGGVNDDEAFSAIETNGGYTIGGWTSSTGAGNPHFWLFKIDKSGNVLIDKTYGEGSTSKAYCLIQTVDGGYVLAGQKTGTDFLVIKTDSNGNTQWEKTYEGPNSNIQHNSIPGIKSIVQTDDNGFVMVGQFSDSSGRLTQLFKIDSSGND